MPTKKTTSASGTKKKTSGTRTSTGKRMNPAGTKRTASTKKPTQTRAKTTTAKKPAAKQPRPINNQFWSVILFAAGVLVLLLTVIPGSKAWLWMHNALLGLFGLGVILVPVILGYTGILLGQERSKTAAGRGVAGVLLMLIAASALQLFIGEPTPEADLAGMLWYERLGVHIAHLWAEGQALHGGGVLSGLLVLPLTWLLDTTGAKIVIVMLIIVLFLLLTNRSIGEMLRLLATPFIWIGRGIVSLATDGIYSIEDEFPEDEDEEEEEPDEPFIIDAPPPVKPAKQKPRKEKEPDDGQIPLPIFPGSRKKSAQEQKADDEIDYMLGNDGQKSAEGFNIDVDIPLGREKQVSPAEEPTPAEPASAADTPAENPTAEADPAFEEIVDRAAQEEAAERESAMQRAEAADDESIYDEEPEVPYVAPPLFLLKRADNSANDADKSMELREKGKQLVDTLASFGVNVRITGIRRGPSVTRYEIQPAAGVKISKITALADDIGLNLGGTSVRISQVEGKPALGVEVPNNTKDTVALRELLESEEFRKSESKLTFAVGKDIDGNVILGDISKMPHMIIAGTTGSGKSVCTNSIIMSILYHASPDEVRLVLVDPKVVEFQPYDGVPHLLIPVVTQPQKAAGALNWAVIEMERRYGLCAQHGVRDLRGYNQIAEKKPELGLKKLPQILIIIDEFADLMMSSGKEVEAAVIRIAQKARAAGIHLIIATQRPTVDVITGLIKSNVPSRIGMSVKSATDSRIILDCTGAETLLGNGDLLFYPNGAREPKRVQGCFVSDREVEAVTTFLKSNGASEYDSEIMDAVEQNIPVPKGEKASGAEDDASELTGEEAIILRAAELAVDMNQLSTTALQRRLKLGYAKAARIMDELEERGVIGPSEGAKPRKVLMSPQQLTEWKLRIAAKGGEVEQ